jgi:hypothetical protein
MAHVFEDYLEFQVHDMVRFLQAEGWSMSEIHSRLASVDGQEVIGRQESSLWLETSFIHYKKKIQN